MAQSNNRTLCCVQMCFCDTFHQSYGVFAAPTGAWCFRNPATGGRNINWELTSTQNNHSHLIMFAFIEALVFIHLCRLFWTAVPVSVLRLSMEAVKWRMESHWQCGPSRELLSRTTAQESCASRQTILMHLLPFCMFMVNAHHNTEIIML